MVLWGGKHGNTTTNRADWLIPAALIALTLVPLLGGVVRLVSLAGNGPITPENARFFAAPVPVLVHIGGSILFCLLGAFQFSPGLRRSHLDWHRIAGRIVVAMGVASAASGLWMTLTYPTAPGSGDLVYWQRLVFGSAMLAGLGLAMAAVLRRDIPNHRAWMIRAYAIGQGAGTQVFTFMPWFILAGNPTGFTRDMLMLAGWLINMVLAEWIIRRTIVRRRVAVA